MQTAENKENMANNNGGFATRVYGGGTQSEEQESCAVLREKNGVPLPLPKAKKKTTTATAKQQRAVNGGMGASFTAVPLLSMSLAVLLVFRPPPLPALSACG